ncbi:MAG: response regulator [Thermodesulfovibrionales bacterium]|nr:response regulator [Thermodesulfovibrionales bacterium]
MGDKKYCICCGEDVPYYIVERDQKREYACSFCGFTLDVLKLWEEREEVMTEGKAVEAERVMERYKELTEAGKKGIEESIGSGVERADELREKGKEEQAQRELNSEDPDIKNVEEVLIEQVSEDKKVTKLKQEPTKLGESPALKTEEDTGDAPFEKEAIRIKLQAESKIIEKEEKGSPERSFAIIAEDSEFLRTLLKELVLRKSLSDTVITATNGLEFIAEYTRLMNERRRINFAIVDINMPEMDGLTAVRTVRALEDRNNRERVPVVFFSAVKADEDLRKQMSILEPASYINKGVSASPKVLAERVEVLLHFLTYRYTRTGKGHNSRPG